MDKNHIEVRISQWQRRREETRARLAAVQPEDDVKATPDPPAFIDMREGHAPAPNVQEEQEKALAAIEQLLREPGTDGDPAQEQVIHICAHLSRFDAAFAGSTHVPRLLLLGQESSAA